MSTVFFRNPKISEFGYDYLKTNVTQGFLCIAPAADDTLATIQGKAIATAAYSGSDVAFSVDANKDFVIDINPKSIAPTGVADALDDIAMVYCSGTEVLVSIDAVDRIITNNEGDTVQIPAARMYSRQLSPAA